MPTIAPCACRCWDECLGWGKDYPQTRPDTIYSAFASRGRGWLCTSIICILHESPNNNDKQQGSDHQTRIFCIHSNGLRLALHRPFFFFLFLSLNVAFLVHRVNKYHKHTRMTILFRSYFLHNWDTASPSFSLPSSFSSEMKRLAHQERLVAIHGQVNIVILDHLKPACTLPERLGPLHAHQQDLFQARCPFAMVV